GEMMKTRMQPIGNVLNKFHRVVRDLWQELRKNIAITISGAETELDKSLLEAIKDPLTHIVRNSCDHGVELPQVRKNSGKAEQGTIAIRSYHEGGQVVIEIADDGKGLNKDVLLQKALEKNLISKEQSAQMTEKEIFNLIFAPGFSTASQITNVSGRGVGMDVVRTNIEKIGGTVDLLSQDGRGTTIRLKIPLTLAIVPALIVSCGDGTFAIPQVKLAELVRVDQSSQENRIEYLQGAPVYRLRGKILPLIDLNSVLGHAHQDAAVRPITNIAVLNAETYSFGLIVDSIQDTADIVVKPLSRLLKSLHVYSGATILGDGSVALILDVQGIAKVARVRNEANAPEKTTVGATDQNSNHHRTEFQDFLLVHLQSPTKHAIILSYVHRLEEFKRSDIEISAKRRVVRYRGAILPLISANELLQYPQDPQSVKDTVSVVVVEKAGHLYGVEVDTILDTLSTTADTDTTLATENGIIGNLNTGQELIVVIDPFQIIEAAVPTRPKLTPVSGEKPLIAKATGPALTGAGLTPKRILLVEDMAFFRKLVTGVLEGAGYQVVSASDGLEACQILDSENGAFDLIISDIEMPRMNGFQFATAIRAHAKYKHLPMLALSSRADKSYLQQGLKAGFNSYLEKMQPPLLLNSIEDVLSLSLGGKSA
ncbi:MAG: chemotaxis protein CheW, partial [Bdellovibrionales bacterium]|nr:chemotaxis protein CheW [Bdellovibrionales bacterium]